MDGGHEFCAIYLPSVLVLQVLRAAHDELGHNGFPRTYAAVKRVFYWKGMKEDIRKHCKACATCILHQSENVKFERKIFRPSLLPMDFICMDLIDEFYPPTSHGHHYALTAVCMFTGFTWCIPLKTKTADEVVKAYLDHIYSKHINHGLEWDELTPACYNFFPNCSARESAFFVMFGRDPIHKLNMMLHSARRYFHDDNGLPNLEALKNIYQVVAQQLLNSRERYVKKHRN